MSCSEILVTNTQVDTDILTTFAAGNGGELNITEGQELSTSKHNPRNLHRNSLFKLYSVNFRSWAQGGRKAAFDMSFWHYIRNHRDLQRKHTLV